jgi:hypothetical protein
MFKPALAMDFKSPVYFGLRHSNHALINHWIIAFIGYGDVSWQYEPISTGMFS